MVNSAKTCDCCEQNRHGASALLEYLLFGTSPAMENIDSTGTEAADADSECRPADTGLGRCPHVRSWTRNPVHHRPQLKITIQLSK